MSHPLTGLDLPKDQLGTGPGPEILGKRGGGAD